MKKLIVSLALLSSVSAVQAVTIAYAARGAARPVDANGSFLADGSLVRIGTFTAGYDFTLSANQTLAALNAAFTQYGATATITEAAATPRVGSINATTTTTGILGKQLFYWIFNAATDTAATQFGIFTNADASYLAAGDEPPTDTTTISLGLAGIQAKIGSTFVSGATTTGKLAVIAAVPEPSTYALMGLGLVVVGFMARRRK